MPRMSELERFVGFSTLLLSVLLFALCFWIDGTNERMARDGFMPLRLQGDGRVYWLPIPTDKRSDNMKDILQH